MYLSLKINVYKYMLVLMCKINKYNILYHRAGVGKLRPKMVCKRQQPSTVTYNYNYYKN